MTYLALLCNTFIMIAEYIKRKQTKISNVNIIFNEIFCFT